MKTNCVSALLAITFSFGFGTLLPGAEPPPTTSLDEVIYWNQLARKTSLEVGLNPPRESRAIAILSMSVFNAMESADGLEGRVCDAAVATAAYRSLLGLFPSRAASLRQEYERAIDKLGTGEDALRGIEIGTASALAVLASREGDRADVVIAFDGESDEVGFWRRTAGRFAPAMESEWGRVIPFVLSDGAELRPESPPELSSAIYLRDFEEVKAIGAKTSSGRDAMQTDVALFWIAAGPQLWNQAIPQLARAQGFDAKETARAFYLVNVAGADALIAAWDAKFFYRQWRPVTAIREAEGNPGAATREWMTLIETPPFPDYPAGHNTYAGAVATVLKSLFGEDPGEFSIRSHTSGTTHVFRSFTAVQEEVENARVWGGAHWRSSCEAGNQLGERVGVAVLRSALSGTVSF